MSNFIKDYEKTLLKAKTDIFGVGDVVKVPVKIKEGNKERIQNFEGTVIAMKNGGIHTTFKVRRVVAGVGVERTFLLHSPKLGEVILVRKNTVRRAKLYYLRDRIGNKATRLKEDEAAGLEIAALLKAERGRKVAEKKVEEAQAAAAVKEEAPSVAAK
jgi:large subunit ribosomal protein L19